MLIELSDAGHMRQSDICMKLGLEELLGQLTEECGELVQAAQKVRRAINGTTPVSLDAAKKHLCEECADVALCIDTLTRMGLVDENGIQFIGRYKNDRWHKRICEEAENGLQRAD